MRRDAGKSRLLFDLHNAFGIYPILFSLIFTLTTLVFAFPIASKSVLYALAGTPADPVFQLDPPANAQPLPIDELIAAADAAIDGRILRVSFPQAPESPLMVRKEWDDWNQTRNHAMVTVDPYTANVLDVYDSRNHQSPGRLIAQWALPLQFGIWGGLPIRILYVLLGFVPAVALVTGFWRWRLRTKAERRSQERLAALLHSAPPLVLETLLQKGLAKD